MARWMMWGGPGLMKEEARLIAADARRDMKVVATRAVRDLGRGWEVWVKVDFKEVRSIIFKVDWLAGARSDAQFRAYMASRTRVRKARGLR